MVLHVAKLIEKIKDGVSPSCRYICLGIKNSSGNNLSTLVKKMDKEQFCICKNGPRDVEASPHGRNQIMHIRTDNSRQMLSCSWHFRHCKFSYIVISHGADLAVHNDRNIFIA